MSAWQRLLAWIGWRPASPSREVLVRSLAGIKAELENQACAYLVLNEEWKATQAANEDLAAQVRVLVAALESRAADGCSAIDEDAGEKPKPDCECCPCLARREVDGLSAAAKKSIERARLSESAVRASAAWLAREAPAELLLTAELAWVAELVGKAIRSLDEVQTSARFDDLEH